MRVRWVGRLADQLGAFSGEILQSPSAHLLDLPLHLAALASSCAVAAAALPERFAHPRSHGALLELLAKLVRRQSAALAVVRWELTLLEELGYGLDLSCCAVTGKTDNLRFVSPRTGRAVSDVGAGPWRDRLLPLPEFVLNQQCEQANVSDCQDGLLLTAYFLARDAFGVRHQAIPSVRTHLENMVHD